MQVSTPPLRTERRRIGRAFAGKFVLFFAAAILQFASDEVKAQPVTFTNPIVKSQSAADPWIVYHGGWYYFTATLDPSGGVWVWQSRTLAGLDEGKKVKVYDAPATGMRSRQIWAPELHRLDDRWYVYFTASDGVDENHRLYVLESRGADPLGPYTLKARLYDSTNDGWAIDPTILRARDGKLYCLWVAHVPGNGNGIRIAPMSNPWTIKGASALIAATDYDWERVRYPINEGPVALERDGKLFIVYSASDTGTPDYALGLLTHMGGDVMNVKSWKKSPHPVFSRHSGPDGNVYGPGHNGFFKSPDGTEDWIIYHGKETAEYTYENRTTRAQKFTWRADGTPDFGRPIPRGVAVRAPAGETRISVIRPNVEAVMKKKALIAGSRAFAGGAGTFGAALLNVGGGATQAVHAQTAARFEKVLTSFADHVGRCSASSMFTRNVSSTNRRAKLSNEWWRCNPISRRRTTIWD